MMALCIITACQPSKPIEEKKADSVQANIDTLQSQEADAEKFRFIEAYLVDKVEDRSQVDVVDSSVVVIVNPTDEQIEQMQKDLGDDFGTIADDWSYYQYTATMAIDSLHIPFFNVDKRYIEFAGKKKWIVDLRKKGAPEWNIILFNKNKSPKVMQGIDVSTDSLRDYFDLPLPKQ
jgi:hypothetical protein